MATDQPLPTNWEIQPLMSAKMRFSLVSWIAFTETSHLEPTDQPLPTNWEIQPLMSAKMRFSLVSWIAFTEHPPWNLSLVLHQLKTAPFEPFKAALLKHLTFITVFLLALCSGIHRSEINTWLSKKIRHHSD